MNFIFLFFITIFIFISIFLLIIAGSIILEEVYNEYQNKYVTSTSQTLKNMFIFIDPKKLFLFNIINTIIFILVGFLISNSPFVITGLGIFGYILPKIIIYLVHKKRVNDFQNQFIDGLTILTNSLKSGRNLIQSIETLEKELNPPISQEFGLVLNENRLGVPIEDALINMTNRINSDDLKLMVISVNIVLGQGGNLTTIFNTISLLIKERTKIEGKTKALTSQGKMQALVVGLLPFILGVVMYFVDPISMNIMFTETRGIIALCAIIVLQIFGYIFVKKVSTIEV